MPKQSGLGGQLYIGGVDIGADISSIDTISTPRETLPGTDITQSGMARLFGKRDATADFSAYFDPAVGASHKTLSPLPYTDTQVMYLQGTAIGNEAFVINGKELNYDGSRGNDGSFMFKTSIASNAFGADWAYQLTAGKRSDTVATNGTSLDLGLGPLSFGFVAYLQVFSFTGTSITISVQDSSDNGSGDAFSNITGGVFTVVSAAPTFERIQSASATLLVDRYVRVATTGTFSQCTFVVAFVRPDALRVL